jgi:hypothetical protein
MRILTILLTLSISLQALACPSYKMVEAEEPSPCKGLFLNQSTNDQVKKDLRDNELRKKQIELKDLQLTEITSDRNSWKSEAKKQSELSHRKDNDMRNGIIAGVGLTLLSIFLVRQVDK